MDEEDVRTFAEEQKASGNLADAFEAAVSRADDVADALRRESDRLADRDQRRQKLMQRERELANADKALQAAQAEFKTVREEWDALWAPIGITPETPKEMEAWLSRRDKILEVARQARDSRDKAADIEAAIGRHRNEIRSALTAMQAPGLEEMTLRQLMDYGEAVVKGAEKQRRTHEQRKEQLTKLTGQSIPEAEHQAEKARSEWEAWEREWTNVMKAMALSPDTDVDIAQEVASQFERLASAWTQYANLKKRLDDIAEAEAAFAERAQALCTELAPDLAERPPEQAIEELRQRVQKQREDHQRREQLDKEMEALRADLQEVEENLDRSIEALKTACEEAGVGDVGEIPAVEERAAERDKWRAERERLDARLAEYAAGEALGAFIEAVTAEDPDRLEAQIARLQDELQRLSDERDDSMRRAGGLRTEFEKFGREEAAAEAAAEKSALLTESIDAAKDYLGLKAAQIILREAMERYRRENQDPLLQRSAAIFRTLTLGSFVDLRADLNEKDEFVLQGVRPGEQELTPVDGMSDGTRDQLFLALRIASIEQYAEKGAGLPFILDDILVNFDDDRASAALSVLSELNSRMQVIFFTHHSHLCELARQTLPPDKLMIHTLETGLATA